MPKATLHFDLPEEQEEYELANKAWPMQSAIYEFSNFLRYRYKHEDPAEGMTAYKEHEEIWKEFGELFEEFPNQKCSSSSP